MRILIGGSNFFYSSFKEFAVELSRFSIDYKLIKDEENYDIFSILKIRHRKQKIKSYLDIMKNYKPDFVLTDMLSHLGLTAIDAKIPLLIYLRGDYWQEIKWADLTIYKNISFQRRFALKRWRRLADKCFKNSTAIITVSEYLKKIVKEHYPDKPTKVMHVGINSNNWYPEEGMKLKHPCVGLVQAANIWGKTKEMLILPKIMDVMQDVTFYWAGDGLYKNKILPELEKYANFEWLGKLEYPQKVRQFLKEIDVYALISGLDMTPISLLEAQLMGKPVVATNIGGISETMKEGETGFLVDEGDYKEWITKLINLIKDEEKIKEMQKKGPDFVDENFNWKKSVEEFLSLLKEQGFN